jgi:hypothetical protein
MSCLLFVSRRLFEGKDYVGALALVSELLKEALLISLIHLFVLAL